MSGVVKKVFKNTIWLSLAELVSSVFLFLFTILVAKYLGAEKYGQLAFALSLATLIAVVMDFGLGTLVIRDVARRKDEAGRYLNNVLFLRIILGLVFISLMVLIAYLSHKGSTVFILAVFAALYMFFNHLMQSFNAIFRAFEKMEYEAVTKIIFSALLFLSALSFMRQGVQVKVFGLLYSLAMLIAFLVSAAVMWKKFIRFRLSFDKEFWKYLLKESWPFALSMVFISIYYYMDTVMLGIMGQDKEVGWYNAAYKIVFFVLLFANISSGAIFPLISRVYIESLERLKSILSNVLKVMVTVALPLAVGGLIVARKVIFFIYGSGYLGGVLAFQILICSASLIYISVIYGNAIQACNKQRIYLKGVALGALANVVLNLIFIPIFSLNGAAVATFLSELAVFIFMYFHLNKIVKIKFYKFLLRPLAASILMGAVLILLEGINIILLILVAIAIYFFLLLLVRGMSFSEAIFYYKIITNKSNE